MLFNFKLKFILNSLCKSKLMISGQKTTFSSQKNIWEPDDGSLAFMGKKNSVTPKDSWSLKDCLLFYFTFYCFQSFSKHSKTFDPNSFQILLYWIRPLLGFGLSVKNTLDLGRNSVSAAMLPFSNYICSVLMINYNFLAM